MTPLDPAKFSFHLSIREWHTVTDEAIRLVFAQAYPTFRECYDFLTRFSLIHKCPDLPPPALFFERFGEEWDDDLDLSEIGFDVISPTLPSWMIFKVAVLMAEDQN